jgi:membrane associated rhomboid family serine protease
MKKVKNIIKFVPVVTLVLFMVNFIITIVDFKSANQFVSDPNGFGVNEIICNFSHVDWSHWMGNSGHLLVMGGMIEIMLSLRKKRMVYIAIIIAAFVGHIILSEVINKFGIGASGWLASLPMIAIPVIVWFAGTSKYWNGDYAHPVWALLPLPLLNVIVGIYWDITMLDSGDGIGHDAHLTGYGFGAVLFAIAAPFAIRAWVHTFARTRAQKRDIAARRLEFRRKMAAQQAAAMAA